MKKNLAIILLTSIMLCCLSLFAACDTGVHTHTIEKVEAVAATCETAGNIEYYRCSDCKKLFSDELASTEIVPESVVLAALGHDEESHDAKAATCTEDGWDAYVTCKRDGCDYTTKVVIPALDHDCDSEVTTQPTCTEKGVRTYTCKRTGCEHTYTEDVAIDPNAHDFESHDAKAATCTEDGYEAYKTCKRNGCDYTTYQKKDAIGHKNKVHHVKVNATCTEAGTIEYWSCPDCNKNYSDEACTKVVTELTIAALDHDMQPVAKKDATCTETGYDAYEQCSRCDHNTKGNDIPALDHDYDSEVTTQPTCTEKGVRTYTCKRTGCEHTYTEDVNALGHDNKGSIARKDATCTEAGVEGGTYCTRCNDGKAAAEATINALGHVNKQYVAEKDATFDTEGNVAHWHCSDCGVNFSDEACTTVIADVIIKAKGERLYIESDKNDVYTVEAEDLDLSTWAGAKVENEGTTVGGLSGEGNWSWSNKLSFTVKSEAAGKVQISLKVAIGKDFSNKNFDKMLQLTWNGEPLQTNFAFDENSDWSNWETVTVTTELDLNEGHNTFVIQSIGEYWVPNLDCIIFEVNPQA